MSARKQKLPENGRHAQGFVTKGRILNPRRLKKVSICASNPAIKRAAGELVDSLPLTDVEILSNPTKTCKKLSDEGDSILVLDDRSILFFKELKFRENNESAGVVYITSNPMIAGLPPHMTSAQYEDTLKADHVFFLDEEANGTAMLTAAIRCARDKINIDAGYRAKRFIFLVVDDQIRWHSQFLPELYDIVGHRAAVLTARSYEQAIEALDMHGENIICLISDIHIPKNDEMNDDHGKQLIRRVKRVYSRIPVIVASQRENIDELQPMGLVMRKGDERGIGELRKYIRRFTGMEDFYFFDEQGRVIGHTPNIWGLRVEVERLPIEILEKYGQQDFFSTWAWMHGHKRLASKLRPMMKPPKDKLRNILLEAIDDEIQAIETAALRFVGKDGEVITEASTLVELISAIGEIDDETLEFYSNRDGFSSWLMRKGYKELAKKLRPVFGQGEELRKKLINEIWTRIREYGEEPLNLFIPYE